jgi:hypothetical protein
LEALSKILVPGLAFSFLLYHSDDRTMSNFLMKAAILIMEIQGAKRSPQATVLLPEPVPVSADKARSFPK